MGLHQNAQRQRGLGDVCEFLPRIRQCAFVETRVTRPRLAVAFLLTALGPLLTQSSLQIQPRRPPEYTFKIIRAFPHDPTAFTQGLAYRNGFLYEGTGLNGRSSLRKVRLETGEVVQRLDLAPEFFGEGITLRKNEVVQLTWQSHRVCLQLKRLPLATPIFVCRGRMGSYHEWA
jgi:hypothetical protein